MGRLPKRIVLYEAINIMAGGNTGAMEALANIAVCARSKGIENLDIEILIALDQMEIYDERIHMLWKDVCGCDSEKVITILDCYLLRVSGVTLQAINHAIDNRVEALDLIPATVRGNRGDHGIPDREIVVNDPALC